MRLQRYNTKKGSYFREAAHNLDALQDLQKKKNRKTKTPQHLQSGIPDVSKRQKRISVHRESKKRTDQIIDEIHKEHRELNRIKLDLVDNMSLKRDPFKFNNIPFEVDNLLWEKANKEREEARKEDL
jgi:hypothetical protein